jgi:N-acetylglucosaminyl-diphospho-decaprenol L-rhamnosyltransferase
MRGEPFDQRTADPVSVIIPAHNEDRSIGRLLESLLADARPDEFEVIVVCNGCSDRTADIARGFDVRVIELAEPSKGAALARGDAEARFFPRLYIDADVVITTDGVRALRSALSQDNVLAAGPERSITLDEASLLVRCYYAVWTRLPQVRTGLFGRGVVAVSAAGHERTSALPPVMSDDLAMSEAFAADERAVVPNAVAVIRPPRTVRDLVRRRIRVATGNAELDLSAGRSAEARTSWSDLLRIVRSEPSLAVCLPVFAGVALTARFAAGRRIRAGDFSTWLRDDSSRRQSRSGAARRERHGAVRLSNAELQSVTPDVAVVVVTYNSEDVIGDLLKSLPDALDGCTWSLVVADNDSHDATVAIVQAMAPDAKVVEMGRNAGYAAGINGALAAAPRTPSALILNPDTRLEPGSIAVMRRTLEAPGVGIVVPRLLDSNRALVPTLRREPNVRRALGDTILTARRAGRFPMWSELVTRPRSYTEESSADWAAGPIMLVSRECLETCGGWDESFFLYSEETEFCLQARDHDFNLVLTPDAEAVHLGGESQSSPSLRALLVVNRIRLYRRSHTLAGAAVFWLIAVVREASRLALRRRSSRQALVALLNPARARNAVREAAGQLPNLQRRQVLARAADSASASIDRS